MCNKNQLHDLMRQTEVYAKELFGEKLRSMILYGSYARGDFDEESDIDIAMIADIPHEDEPFYHARLVKIVGDLYERFGYSPMVSIVVISSGFFEQWKNDLPFYRNIAEEGVKIVA